MVIAMVTALVVSIYKSVQIILPSTLDIACNNYNCFQNIYCNNRKSNKRYFSKHFCYVKCLTRANELFNIFLTTIL